MSKTPQKRSEAEEKLLIAFGSFTLFVVLPIMWLFDLGPFGWFDEGEVAESESVPKVMVADGFAGLCQTKRAVQMLEEAVHSKNQPKMEMVFRDGGCIWMDPNVRVKHIDGISVIKVEYEGTVGYTTSGWVKYIPVPEVQKPLN